MALLFISDLHLSAQRPELVHLFLRFLEERAAASDGLYVLGDLFEAWLGDDFILPEYRPVIDALRGLTRGGVPVHLMHGNRDFLIGDEFERLTGCRLIPDPTVIDLYGRRALLMHGDTLCTRDVAYQELREKLRNLAFIREFLAKPAEERLAVARDLRERSEVETGAKEAYLMDVNPEAVEQVMREQRADLLIHGHTHRPGHHQLSVNDRPAERYVLGDWYKEGCVLICEAGECRFEALPI